MSYPSRVSFAGVGRFEKLAILAAVFGRMESKDERAEIRSKFLHTMENMKFSSRAVPENREKASFIGGYMYLLVDKEAKLVYGMATPYNNFLDKEAFAILQEVITAVELRRSPVSLAEIQPDKLTPIIKSRVRGIMDKHQDVGLSEKTLEVHEKLSEVKDVMHGNVQRILDATSAAESLNVKSRQLNEHSTQFSGTSRNLHNALWWRRTKVTAVLAIVLLSLIVYLAIYFSH